MHALIDAIQQGSVSALRDAIRRRPQSVNELYEDQSALAWICSTGNAQMAEVLFMHGADPNLGGSDGETPLHLSAFDGAIELVRLLLRHGAYVDPKTDEGKTPLMSAAQSGSVACVDEFLSAGADSTLVDAAGRTCLHWACLGEHDSPIILNSLILSGVDLRRRTNDGMTAGDYAADMRKKNILERLAPLSG